MTKNAGTARPTPIASAVATPSLHPRLRGALRVQGTSLSTEHTVRQFTAAVIQLPTSPSIHPLGPCAHLSSPLTRIPQSAPLNISTDDWGQDTCHSFRVPFFPSATRIVSRFMSCIQHSGPAPIEWHGALVECCGAPGLGAAGYGGPSPSSPQQLIRGLLTAPGWVIRE
jgi:hypothetical protein